MLPTSDHDGSPASSLRLNAAIIPDSASIANPHSPDCETLPTSRSDTIFNATPIFLSWSRASGVTIVPGATRISPPFHPSTCLSESSFPAKIEDSRAVLLPKQPAQDAPDGRVNLGDRGLVHSSGNPITLQRPGVNRPS